MRIYFSIILLGLSGLLRAQSSKWTGQWVGNLETPEIRLAMMFRVEVKYAGWYSKLNIPQQGVKDFTVSKTSIDKKTIRFELEQLDAWFEGKLTDSCTIKGYFHQHGKSYHMQLKRVWGIWPKPKPQTPLPPYSFFEERMKIPVAGGRIMVGATLAKPDSTGKFPVVVLISGSGPQDRNGTIGEHEPFLVLTQFFTSHGYAVFRFDDRGAGETKGHPESLKNTTTADIGKDVEIFVNLLKQRSDIDSSRIGLLGHSEGGVVAPMVAAHNRIAFVISMAGPAAGGLEANIFQNENALKDHHVGKRTIRSYIKIHRQMIAAALGSTDTSVIYHSMDSLIRQWKRTATWKAKYILFGGRRHNYYQVHRNYSFVQIPWWRFFMSYQPMTDIKKVNCPILALNGSRDMQVTCNPNLDSFEKAKVINPHITTLCLPGLNHLFQHCSTCNLQEYYTLSETLNKALMENIEKWMRDEHLMN